jgi:hypothetical protein
LEARSGLVLPFTGAEVPVPEWSVGAGWGNEGTGPSGVDAGGRGNRQMKASCGGGVPRVSA